MPIEKTTRIYFDNATWADLREFARAAEEAGIPDGAPLEPMRDSNGELVGFEFSVNPAW